MIEIDEALTLILQNATPLDAEVVELADSRGRFLAEDVRTDVDVPPHDKSLVDGYAVVSSDLESGVATPLIADEILAGQVPTIDLRPGHAVRIMTGAPVPKGADAIVMVEQTQEDPSGERVTIEANPIAGENIQPQAHILRKDEIVLRRGTRIRSVEIGLLAEVGAAQPRVVRVPEVAILPTGDEIVDAASKPAPGQIRNSNGPMLVSLARATGAKTLSLGVGRDNLDELRALVVEGLNRDVLILSGGVSMGRRDLVPEVLDEHGVEQVFHRVRLRPGKPIWFGVKKSGSRQTLVFGLPGNPISSLACFCLFVKPALLKMMGGTSGPKATAPLADDYSFTGKRPTLLPGRHRSVENASSVPGQIEVLAWKGSADQRTLSMADCFAFFPSPREYSAGESVDIIRLDL